ncbi:LPXTG cell wall anchor domain-containing protein [Corynebacterium diphtheriae]|uniref:LPXTG cell wall anchor domain-containing protein n=1 Tax=Corynebacterium diphtheriae TaxID=1717 RepID=UPI0009B77D98|nr:LPXTG cell wall anchor domain-containing protein [Corynebacterium diphtheriae bv. gravis]MBG9345385.1 LPXTG cell wall anchor domain-containing protein [Corynebacterium diphtheriae bv. gravis]MBG9352349.1 LPXTG cell wall anchor domain-containing protein [Corynebacterium diphtheriae bv. gravis]MBG9370333.1 LPXTG cell wall anchor domain-containing protein [Corynebacterium diphtheriae bv. gravis]MBG9380910.1 LPXTG cell wall anchor domain-containing protein [Corynebacterium diphtheriae bv. gravis
MGTPPQSRNIGNQGISLGTKPRALQVADVHLGQLPKTGGVGVGLFASFGALLICIGILLARRKKHY